MTDFTDPRYRLPKRSEPFRTTDEFWNELVLLVPVVDLETGLVDHWKRSDGTKVWLYMVRYGGEWTLEVKTELP